jgi:hypothetical protein
MFMRGAVVLGVVIIINLVLSPFAQAQTSDQNKQGGGTTTGNPKLGGGTTTGNPKLVDTNIPGVRAFAVPPADFSINTASDEELNAYGIPPRPDEKQNPHEHADWLRKYSKTRIMPSLVLKPNVFHGVAEIKKVETKSPTLQISHSNNWSGYVITDSTNMFKTPNTRISAVFPQPKAVTGCTPTGPGDYHASFWVGIDGWQSNDVLQVGTELDMNCASGVNNYGWIEWFDTVNKYPEIQINNLPVGPGDLVEADVWLEAVSPGVLYYALFFSVGAQYVLLSLTPPPGVTLSGNCIEWIAERPTINGVYANLTNYLLMPWFSVNTNMPSAGLQIRPSNLPPTSTLVEVVMDQGSNTGVSTPTFYAGSWPSQWDDGIVFSTMLPY